MAEPTHLTYQGVSLMPDFQASARRISNWYSPMQREYFNGSVLNDGTLIRQSQGASMKKPSKKITNEQLVAVMKLHGMHEDQRAEMLDNLAQLQKLSTGETLIRCHQIREDIVGDYVKLADGTEGIVTDVTPYSRNQMDAQLVINGKIHKLNYTDLVTRTSNIG